MSEENSKGAIKVPGTVVMIEFHPDVTTFDGMTLADNRAKIELQDFAVRFEEFAGNTVPDLSSRSRSKSQILERIEFATLAVTRYGYRGCDVAALLKKTPKLCHSVVQQGPSQGKLGFGVRTAPRSP
jgi:hypothetical protein